MKPCRIQIRRKQKIENFTPMAGRGCGRGQRSTSFWKKTARRVGYKGPPSYTSFCSEGLEKKLAIVELRPFDMLCSLSFWAGKTKKVNFQFLYSDTSFWCEGVDIQLEFVSEYFPASKARHRRQGMETSLPWTELCNMLSVTGLGIVTEEIWRFDSDRTATTLTRKTLY